jgi:predicted  nucleic acid-binding Zn-ribbon protein
LDLNTLVYTRGNTHDISLLERHYRKGTLATPKGFLKELRSTIMGRQFGSIEKLTPGAFEFRLWKIVENQEIVISRHTRKKSSFE